MAGGVLSVAKLRVGEEACQLFGVRRSPGGYYTAVGMAVAALQDTEHHACCARRQVRKPGCQNPDRLRPLENTRVVDGPAACPTPLRVLAEAAPASWHPSITVAFARPDEVVDLSLIHI